MPLAQGVRLWHRLSANQTGMERYSMRGIILPQNPHLVNHRLSYPSVNRRQGYGRIAPTVDFPRRRAGIKSSTREGLVQPTSKGWLNPIHGLQVIGADSDRLTLDGNATGNSASVPMLGYGRPVASRQPPSALW